MILDLKLLFQTLSKRTNALGVFTFISLADLLDSCNLLYDLAFCWSFSTLPVSFRIGRRQGCMLSVHISHPKYLWGGGGL